MARPQKVGLDYFPLDVDIDQDDKVAIIEAQHGILGFSIVIKLLMKVYSEGYYYDWTEKEQILFSKRVNVDINEVNVIINDCIKWGLFDERLFKEQNILTSKGIQVRYFEAVKRRQKVEIAKEFLLLDDETVKNYTNLIIVSINEDIVELEKINVDINQDNGEVSVNINPQSKVKESKVNKSILNKTTTEDKGVCSGSSSKDNGPDELDNDLSKVTVAFQSNGFGTINATVKETIIELLDLYSTEWIMEAMKIAVEANKRSLRYVKGILENWTRSGGMQTKIEKTIKNVSSIPVKKNRFHNFDQRSDDYSADQLEDIAARKRREHAEKLRKQRESGINPDSY
ncbi:Lin1244/Lin1753 domain-containing protein [Tissierella sp. Yu-01]|uniref:Lin1244/Lin1753 domain-containing protein n=1 Tax=Tissierella sp. Yu-01 TaxID=3035694 RepID=UPI00240DEE6E|nr:Lin1244/Lin1753 domain-containing protein [Tissierella sp. Yu-01]WFA10364.1 DUF4373 domain-containing protein [Tissierella sp. Yu-01]